MITIATDQYKTDLLIVGKGVLQGDCLSLLLFNMVVNTLIKTVDQDHVRCMGHTFSNMLIPKHWFQFADDSAITTTTEEDCQLLLNVVTKWCNWAALIIRADKCTTFGIKKNGSCACQFRPYMIINNEMIRPVEIGESFIYLGKSFSFDMSTEHVKNELITDFNKYISILNQLPLHPKNKLQVISKFIYSKIRWQFSIYRLSETWVIQNLDSIIKEYVK